MRTALAALLAGLAGAGLVYWKSQRDAAALRAELEQRAKPVSTNPAVPAESQPAAPEHGKAKEPVEKIVTVKVPDEATRKELVRLLDEKNAKLAAAEADLRELRERVAELDTKLSQIVRDNDQLASSQRDLKQQLDTATRLAESLREQSRSREERLAQAEVSAQDLRKRSEETSRRLARLGEVTEQMDDVARRRDNYLNSVLRRFREATELFRTLALRIDDPNLARIQQTITAADEDLRQIQALSAQAARLQKDLALARK
jgi:chromosome segregation protein